MKTVKFLIFIIYIISMWSCKSNESRIYDMYNHLKGMTVVFPKDAKNNSGITNVSFAMDTTEVHKYTILNYIDSNGCTECGLKLNSWKVTMKRLNEDSRNVNLIMILKNGRVKDAISLIKRANFQYQVLIDSENAFRNMNPELFKFDESTFLLDSLNRIVSIGSPIENKHILKVFKKYISERK